MRLLCHETHTKIIKNNRKYLACCVLETLLLFLYNNCILFLEKLFLRVRGRVHYSYIICFFRKTIIIIVLMDQITHLLAKPETANAEYPELLQRGKCPKNA